ncbi:pH-response regulator protein palA/rim20 [Allomyces arbusculus]|nr:pH-response regulator protein palA/rim20 [Allomyces arbusculus]
MATTMLAIDFRRTQHVDMADALRRYIVKAYGEPAESYTDDFRSLDQMRAAILAPEPHPASVDAHLRYYAQLKHVGAKFPVDEHTLRVVFPWWPAFAKDKKPVKQAHLSYDRASVLFNLAAIYSHLGANEVITTDEGIRRACELFKRSAGAIATLQGQLEGGELRHATVTLDWQPCSLTCFAHAMTAQAVECMWLKAVAGGTSKPLVLAKIASEVARLHGAAVEAMAGTQAAHMPGMVHWINHLKAKRDLYLAHANVQKAIDCETKANYGEGVARLQLAAHLLKRALSDAKHVPAPLAADLKSLDGKVAVQLASAQKDNDVVYVQQVPAADQLPPIPGYAAASLGVEPVALNLDDFGSVIGAPLFAQLVPYEIYQKASEYTAKRDAVVADLAKRVKSVQEAAWAALRATGAQGVLDAVANPHAGVPAAVADRARAFAVGGGVRHLDAQIDVLRTAAAQARAKLDAIDAVLDGEASDDREMKAQFRERWTRTASIDLQRQIRDRLADLKEKLGVAVASDKYIAQKLAANREKLEMLERSNDQLAASLPAMMSALSVSDATYQQLAQAVNEYSSLVRSGDALAEQLKQHARTDAIEPELLALVAEHGTFRPVDAAPILDTRLAAYTSTFTPQIDGLESRTSQAAEAVQLAADAVRAKTGATTTASAREQSLNDLDAAFTVAQEIASNCKEGHKFYSDLGRVLGDLHRQAEDFAHARGIEKRDLIAYLTSAIASGDQALSSPSTPRGARSPPPLPPRQGSGNMYPGAGFVPGTWQPDQPVRFSTPKK